MSVHVLGGGMARAATAPHRTGLLEDGREKATSRMRWTQAPRTHPHSQVGVGVSRCW